MCGLGGNTQERFVFRAFAFWGRGIRFFREGREIVLCEKTRSTGVTVVLRAHGARVVLRVFTIYLLERALATPAKRECALMKRTGQSGGFLAFAV